MRLPKRKSSYKSRYMPARRERWREFWRGVNAEKRPHSTLGQPGGMGLGGPAPPVDVTQQRREREAEEMDREQAYGRDR